MDKLRMQSTDGVQDNIKKIATLFPDCVTETMDSKGNVVRKVDSEKLLQNLSEEIISDKEERYQFTWPDKRKAILAANAPINATLRPCRGESLDFDNTQNLYIEGDNLDVLKCLKETYLHKVKMIYIDPPYNTGNDFVYEDDFAQSSADYLANSGQFDEQGNRLFTNTESNGRFHTDWLNMIYPRLKVARDLLTDDGVIFISIDDNEQANLEKLCDEIYGSSNFVGKLIHQRAKGGGQAKYIVKGHDYILVYAYCIDKIDLSRKKVVQKKTVEKDGELYIINDDVVRKVFGKYDKSLGDRRCFYEELEKYKGIDKKREIDEEIEKGNLFLKENDEGFHIICRYEKVNEARSKLYSIIKVLSEEGKIELENLGITGFNYPKPTNIVKQLVEAGITSKDSIILDFFSGSATTAHAVMQLNAEDGGKRKFIMVQLPELTEEDSPAYKAGYKNICEIGKERIRRAGKKIKEESPATTQSLDIGFRVLKLDSTNMRDIYYSPAETAQDSLFGMVDNVKDDRTSEDLLFQVMLELGAPLSSKIEISNIEGKVVYNVADNYLVACFDKDVTDKVVTQMAKMQPEYAVLRDTSMANDSTTSNFEQIFKTYSPNTITKIL